ncbi:MAG TPA: hypothetical protein VD948_08955 [Rhodothermales bacterium]|nr:hypothetical protein [Rhodothermales bacterium]
MPDLFPLLTTILLMLSGGTTLFALGALLISRALQARRPPKGPALILQRVPHRLQPTARGPVVYRALPAYTRPREERTGW